MTTSEVESTPPINNKANLSQTLDAQEESRRTKASSAVWDVFEKLPVVKGETPKARCKFCKKVLSCKSTGGTSHLKRHIESCPRRVMRDIRQYTIAHESQSSGMALSNYKINAETIRREIGLMVVAHEHPFVMVEEEGFRRVLAAACPEFKMMSRQTIKRDIMLLYTKEKANLLESLNKVPGRVCLTSDAWKSVTEDHYICITLLYVDEEWVLQKRIIQFKLIPPPYDRFCIEDEMSSCISEWNIEHKLLTITLDNASTNDSVVSMLKNRLNAKNLLLCDGEFFHIRCSAHILNLIVQSAFDLIVEIIGKLRFGIKYVKQSAHRKKKFYGIATKLSVETKKKLCLDCPTRWNAIFHMLEVALHYKLVFVHWGERDAGFAYNLSQDEWNKVEILCDFLRPFYEVTCRFSGVKYPTSNLYFLGVWQIHMNLLEVVNGAENFLTPMVKEMQKKFDKYWYEYSLILSCAVVFDPRYKLKCVEYCFEKVYGTEAKDHVSQVTNTLKTLFDSYKKAEGSSSNVSNNGVGAQRNRTLNSSGNDLLSGLDNFEGYSGYSMQMHKSELDFYLLEPCMDRSSDVDVLKFWSETAKRYPELSRLARDIPTIPISTVASESTFSTGHRVISPFRSSLKSKTIRALICLRDWIRAYYDTRKRLREETNGDEDGSSSSDSNAESSDDDLT